MKNLNQIANPYNDDKVHAACGLFGVMSTSGEPLSGRAILRAMANMHDRGNGLGGGFAAYGIYPEYADCYALHIMFNNVTGKELTERYLHDCFTVVAHEEVPHRRVPGLAAPLVWRYFVQPPAEAEATDDDQVVAAVMFINTEIADSFVFSSGKNMAVFKGVGHPTEIGHFFCVDEYEAYLWTAHSRFPTNTQAWWGGAHPFALLDWTVVHNGELSSYGTNRNYLESFGYRCTLHTDTEVLAYAVDLLMRRQKLPAELMAQVLAPPLWETIRHMPAPERLLATHLRQAYSGLLMNGPFTIIVAHAGEMIGLSDRVRLRPMVVATSGNRVFISSEEAAIRVVSPKLDQIWSPLGGQPVIVRQGEAAAAIAGAGQRQREAMIA